MKCETPVLDYRRGIRPYSPEYYYVLGEMPARFICASFVKRYWGRCPKRISFVVSTCKNDGVAIEVRNSGYWCDHWCQYRIDKGAWNDMFREACLWLQTWLPRLEHSQTVWLTLYEHEVKP